MPGNTSGARWDQLYGNPGDRSEVFQQVYDAVRYMDIMCKRSKGYKPMLDDVKRMLRLLGYRVVNHRVVEK